MITFKDILNEITVSKPVPNNLQRLLALQKEIKTTKDKKRLSALAILCAELVLPIWNHYYPNDGRVKQTIDAAKEERYDDAAVYAAADAADDADDDAAAAAAADAADAAYYAAADAAAYAIKATKLHFKIN